MSPDERGAVGAIARLRREIAHDRQALTAHHDDAAGVFARWSADPPQGDRAIVAVALHGWYTALEAILERIARSLDDEVPTGDAWHRDLLFQATAEVPNIRPAVIPPELTDDLLELLGFRHFFRHGYAVALDPPRLQRNLARLAGVAAQVDAALDAFDQFLAAAAATAHDIPD